MLFKEIINVDSQNRTEPINTKHRFDRMLMEVVHIATTQL
jgi:hypothetical protein